MGGVRHFEKKIAGGFFHMLYRKGFVHDGAQFATHCEGVKE